MRLAVCFGDSITQQGFGAGGWLSLLAEQFAGGKADVLNRGCSGYTSALALSHGYEWAFPPAAPAPLFVVVCFGANDAALHGFSQHVPLEAFASNLGRLLGLLRGRWPGLELLLVSPPPLDDALWAAHCRATSDGPPSRLLRVTAQYREAAAGVATRQGAVFVDLFDGRFDEPGLLSDGLHLTPAGNRLLFEAVWQRLSPAAKAAAPAFPYWRDLLEAPN